MRTLLLAALLAGLAIPARADLITFETDPNGATPTDDAALTTSYAITGGSVSFYFLDSGGNQVAPLFEAAGEDNNDGYVSRGSNPNDTDLDPNWDLDDWFLRQPDGIGVLPGPFVIDYNTTEDIDELSGEIWDIDGLNDGTSEQWLVEVLDSSGNVVDSKLSPLGNQSSNTAPLDSKAWIFAFSGLAGNDVDKVQLTFVGTKTDGIGLAFDNYSAFQAVPEPSSVALVGLGLAGLGVIYRRTRKG